jgi:hypothetical protein
VTQIRKTGCNYGHYAVLSSAIKRCILVAIVTFGFPDWQHFEPILTEAREPREPIFRPYNQHRLLLSDGSRFSRLTSGILHAISVFNMPMQKTVGLCAKSTSRRYNCKDDKILTDFHLHSLVLMPSCSISISSIQLVLFPSIRALAARTFAARRFHANVSRRFSSGCLCKSIPERTVLRGLLFSLREYLRARAFRHFG